MKAIHVDGPPYAFFEYKDGEETNKCFYRKFGFVGENPARLMRAVDKKISAIEKQCLLNSEKYEAPVIFWRRRVELVFEEARPADINFNSPATEGKWRASFRLGCIPLLTNAQWEMLNFVPDGAPFLFVDGERR